MEMRFPDGCLLLSLGLTVLVLVLSFFFLHLNRVVLKPRDRRPGRVVL